MEPKMGVAVIILGFLGIAGWWVVQQGNAPPPPPPPVVQEIDPDTEPDFTPALRSVEDQKVLDAFRASKQQDHAYAARELLAAENYWGPDYCGKNRDELRDALIHYAKTRSEDLHAALSGKLMTRSEMTELWGSADDKLALHQANDRLHTGVLIRSDFPQPDALYLKIYTFAPDVKPSCGQSDPAKLTRLEGPAGGGGQTRSK
jgi:hypothetical protein